MKRSRNILFMVAFKLEQIMMFNISMSSVTYTLMNLFGCHCIFEGFFDHLVGLTHTFETLFSQIILMPLCRVFDKSKSSVTNYNSISCSS